MINIVEAEKEFKKYSSQFKVSDQKVEIKIIHTSGVVKMAEYLAKELKLSQEDVELAKLIGLLHDIGRFEQAVKYNNYEDYNTVDHADLAIEILFEKNLIRNFVEDTKYDNIIKVAIQNHNKFEIKEGLKDKELLHAKIVRDADKLDNFMIKPYQDFYSLYRASEKEVATENITEGVWNEFLAEKLIVASHRVTNMDKWLSCLAWVYDYNFEASFEFIKENGCIDKIIDRLDYTNPDTKEKMEYAREKIKKYIEKRMEK